MPLLQRIPGHHTIHEFRRAAGQRYGEAARLVLAGDRLAAIYLSGYAAEMLLKAAFFRLAGRTSKTPITLGEIKNVPKQHAQALGLPQPGNLHDLVWWADLLAKRRQHLGVAYSTLFARAIMARAGRIYVNWRESLRYRANRPYPGEVAVTLSAVKWLIVQYRHL